MQAYVVTLRNYLLFNYLFIWPPRLSCSWLYLYVFLFFFLSLSSLLILSSFHLFLSFSFSFSSLILILPHYLSFYTTFFSPFFSPQSIIPNTTQPPKNNANNNFQAVCIIAQNPFLGKEWYINPTYVANVQSIIDANPSLESIIRPYQNVPTAYWLDKQSKVPDAEGILNDAVAKQTASGKPGLVFFIVYLLSLFYIFYIYFIIILFLSHFFFFFFLMLAFLLFVMFAFYLFLLYYCFFDWKKV